MRRLISEDMASNDPEMSSRPGSSRRFSVAIRSSRTPEDTRPITVPSASRTGAIVRTEGPSRPTSVAVYVSPASACVRSPRYCWPTRLGS